MYRFKTFDSRDCTNDIQSLEASVNAWMEQEHPRIRLMCQTPVGDHVLLSFVFEVVAEIAEQPTKAVTAIPDVFEENLEDTTLDPNEPPPITGDINIIQ